MARLRTSQVAALILGALRQPQTQPTIVLQPQPQTQPAPPQPPLTQAQAIAEWNRKVEERKRK